MADVKFQASNDAIAHVDQDVTISGFGDVSAALFLAGNRDAGTIRTDSSVFTFGAAGFGATFGQGFARTSSKNAVSPSDDDRGSSSTQVIYVRPSDPSVIVEASIRTLSSGLVTDGLTLDYLGGNGATLSATSILIGGSDVTDVFCDEYQFNLGNPGKVTTGFEPDVVIVITNAASGGVSSATGGVMSIGICVNDGTDKQHCMIFASRNGLSTTDCDGAVLSNRIAGDTTNGFLQWQAWKDNFVSDGFDMNYSGNPSTDDGTILALKFSNNPSINLDIIDSPTTTGSYSTSFEGHQPDFCLLLGSDVTATDTVQACDGFSVNFFDGTTAASHNYDTETGVNPSNAQSVWNAKAIKDYTDGGDTLLHEGTFTEFNSNGFTLDMTTAASTARKWISFSIGNAAASAASPAPLQNLENQFAAVAASKLGGVIQQ